MGTPFLRQPRIVTAMHSENILKVFSRSQYVFKVGAVGDQLTFLF